MKNNKYGPLILSGGIKVYIDFNYLFMTDDCYQFPQNLMTVEKNFSLSQYRAYIQEQQKIPFVIEVLFNQKGFVIGRRKHPIWHQLADQIAPERMRYISVTNLLRQWNKSKNKHKKLKLRFFLAD